MEANRAAENLQTIRTIMERSALYRRALAPIMIWCGVVGIIGGLVGWKMEINSDRGFVLFWAGAAVLALTRSFFLVRQQAMKDCEPFWSPPTRRVTQALIPPFFIGLVASATFAAYSHFDDPFFHIVLIFGWTWLFGCAIHSAGFFMPRGIKWFGWIFIGVGCALLWWLTNNINVVATLVDEMSSSYPRLRQKILSPHLLMGGIFGGLHLAYGIYLYLTESRKTVA